MLLLLLLGIVLLLLLNAFFAFAEFAAVKARPTWVEQLQRSGHPKAAVIRHMQEHVDEYLSVVQVGITLTSIGLGFLGEPAMARMLTPVLAWAGGVSEGVAHGLAVSIGYLLVSFLHIVLGELVPKGMAVRSPERAALWTAPAMRFFYYAFYLPRVTLHRSARFVLRLAGVRRPSFHEDLSEDEIRLLLGQTQARGMLSMRRLLMIENVLDFGSLKVRDAMRPRDEVAVVREGINLQGLLTLFREKLFSRYPYIDAQDRCLGTICIKDVLRRMADGEEQPDLKALVRPNHAVGEEAPLEELFAELQRRRDPVGLVTGAGGRWTGIVTMEDILEELVGTLGDEFEIEKPVFLADLLSPEHILLDLRAASLKEAIGEVAGKVRSSLPVASISEALQRREDAMTTYVGRGVAIPHARLPGLDRPHLIFARSRAGLSTHSRDEVAYLLFAVLTPAEGHREHIRIVSRIAALADSDYVLDRLRQVHSAAEVLQVLRDGDQSVNPE